MATPLSDFEMKLVTDAQVLLTKSKIIKNIIELFGELSEYYKNIVEADWLAVVNDTGAKISRGEYYKGLPYVMLDYPRQFGKQDVFAIRTFFWWGNFFSITLQLSGEYKIRYAAAIKKAIDANVFEGWYFGCGDSPWQHHFESSNYRPIYKGESYDISNPAHLKIAKKIPLTKWDDVDIFFKENFTFLIKVLASQAPIL